MCWSCAEEYGALYDAPRKPEVTAAAALITELYALPGCSVGGPLHIVTDDTNVEDHMLDWCAENMDGWMAEWWPRSSGTAGADPAPVRAKATQVLDALRPLSLADRAIATLDA